MDILMNAMEKDKERAAWELWLTFDGKAKTEMPFNKYLQYIKKKPQREQDKRSDDEVIQDAEDILKMMKRT